ncbi:uncharacterized protein LOC126982333 [Eriocheir sinensis]|uniref:uncharacterized protein LOC126982333 n=1 Tax=Eriocheir sinensis TaxID=95602 RepID=UPI0021C93672|nr:uncharacterized protein LOC126982333 [Eriocheir sinensis]
MTCESLCMCCFCQDDKPILCLALSIPALCILILATFSSGLLLYIRSPKIKSLRPQQNPQETEGRRQAPQRVTSPPVNPQRSLPQGTVSQNQPPAPFTPYLTRSQISVIQQTSTSSSPPPALPMLPSNSPAPNLVSYDSVNSLYGIEELDLSYG